jgi:hypothetical protein
MRVEKRVSIPGGIVAEGYFSRFWGYFPGFGGHFSCFSSIFVILGFFNLLWVRVPESTQDISLTKVNVYRPGTAYYLLFNRFIYLIF